MASFQEWVDTFERMMAAVAFAEKDDRLTACRFMERSALKETLRAADRTGQRAARRRELRM